MKIWVKELLALGFAILLSGVVWADQASGRAEKSGGVMSLLPGDDEVPGWKRSERLLRASNEEELYRIINGEASLYVQYGFRSFGGQSYKGPKGLELEVYIFDQKTPQNAEDLYENPFTKPSRRKEIDNLGQKARIDMTPLFGYGVDFVAKGFFVRVFIHDKTEDGLNSAMAFARLIVQRIRTSGRAGGNWLGSRGGIPPKAGHHEAVVLPSVRVGKNFVWPDLARFSVFYQVVGNRCLAEPKRSLRNSG